MTWTKTYDSHSLGDPAPVLNTPGYSVGTQHPYYPYKSDAGTLNATSFADILMADGYGKVAFEGGNAPPTRRGDGNGHMFLDAFQFVARNCGEVTMHGAKNNDNRFLIYLANTVNIKEGDRLNQFDISRVDGQATITRGNGDSTGYARNVENLTIREAEPGFSIFGATPPRARNTETTLEFVRRFDITDGAGNDVYHLVHELDRPGLGMFHGKIDGGAGFDMVTIDMTREQFNQQYDLFDDHGGHVYVTVKGQPNVVLLELRNIEAVKFLDRDRHTSHDTTQYTPTAWAGPDSPFRGEQDRQAYLAQLTRVENRQPLDLPRPITPITLDRETGEISVTPGAIPYRPSQGPDPYRGGPY